MLARALCVHAFTSSEEKLVFIYKMKIYYFCKCQSLTFQIIFFLYPATNIHCGGSVQSFPVQVFSRTFRDVKANPDNIEQAQYGLTPLLYTRSGNLRYWRQEKIHLTFSFRSTQSRILLVPLRVFCFLFLHPPFPCTVPWAVEILWQSSLKTIVCLSSGSSSRRGPSTENINKADNIQFLKST